MLTNTDINIGTARKKIKNKVAAVKSIYDCSIFLLKDDTVLN